MVVRCLPGDPLFADPRIDRPVETVKTVWWEIGRPGNLRFVAGKVKVKTRERKRSGTEVVNVSAYLPMPLYRRLRARADRDGRKISVMLERAIAAYLDRLDEQD